MNHIDTATWKLTAWYLAIIMIVSVSFSVVIYQITARELDRPLSIEARQLRYLSRIDEFRNAGIAQALESKRAVVTNLVIMNLATMALGAGASYFFARRSLQPIEEAMEAQSRFVSDASHELRTPLAVMRAENDVALREKSPTTKALKQTLTSNLEEVDRLQQLTDRLLALSSQQPVTLAAFALDDAINEVVHRYELAARKKNIEIKLDTVAAQVVADLDMVCDILSILVDNALKYSPSATSVTIATQTKNNKIIVSVADQGAGVSDEEKTKIFERFYRSDESRSKQRVEGYGLGLALAQRLSEINKAHLTVADNHPQGAVFALELDKA